MIIGFKSPVIGLNIMTWPFLEPFRVCHSGILATSWLQIRCKLTHHMPALLTHTILDERRRLQPERLAILLFLLMRMCGRALIYSTLDPINYISVLTVVNSFCHLAASRALESHVLKLFCF